MKLPITTSTIVDYFRGKGYDAPVVMGTEKIMSKKAHGTTATPLQKNLRWGCDAKTADKICCYNRHFAEYAGYFQRTSWVSEMQAKDDENSPENYCDPCTGRVLFTAPVGRTFEALVAESERHGWPSFRDNEVNWKYVRVLPGGECVSVDGTHLGHNLPDKKGNRYCINLVSVCGIEVPEAEQPPVPRVALPMNEQLDNLGEYVVKSNGVSKSSEGMMFRSDPRETGEGVILAKYNDWPKIGGSVKGEEFEVKGKKWLKVELVKATPKAKFQLTVAEDAWLPMQDPNGFFLESA